MYAFELQQPKNLQQAITMLAIPDSRPLAGGQSLVAALKLRLSAPAVLVDLGALEELRGIHCDGAVLQVGAASRHAQVAESALVAQAIPALAELAAGIGDAQVRNMGTLGGSLANNDPAACYPCAVLGLGASIQTDRRAIGADDFFTGMYETALEYDELITAVRFPIPRQAAYVKFHNPASRFALVGVFVARFDAGVRVAVTGCADHVFRASALEAALDADFSPQAARAVTMPATDLSSDLHASAAYRAHLIPVLAGRAVAKALRQPG